MYPSDLKVWEKLVSFKNHVQNWIKSSMEDSVAKILAKNSFLTSTQLETLLIDVLAENVASRRLKYEEKAKLRQTKAAVSRGSFNRTLQQAKRNTIKSIYTLLLLGYFGVIEDVSLSPYLEVASKLKTYQQSLKQIMQRKQTEGQLTAISHLQQELKETLVQLSKPWTTSQQ